MTLLVTSLVVQTVKTGQQKVYFQTPAIIRITAKQFCHFFESFPVSKMWLRASKGAAELIFLPGEQVRGPIICS